MRPLALLLTLLLAAPAAHAYDSASTDRDDSRSLLDPGASFRSWDVKDSAGVTTTISQIQVPFMLTIPASPAVDLVAYGAWARTRLKLDNGDEGTLEGITDLKVKAVVRPIPHAMLAVGVNLPAGKQTLDEASDTREIEVAQAMWSPLLDFRTRRMGEGFDLDLSAGGAWPLSPSVTLGFGVGAVFKSQYDLIQNGNDVTTFKPGSESTVSVGLDARPGPSTLLRFDVAGRAFGRDASNDLDIFQAGTQVELEGLFSHQTPGWGLTLRGRQVSKQDDKVLTDTGGAVSEAAVRTAGSFTGSGEIILRAGKAVALGGEAQYSTYGKSDLVLSDGHTFSIGPVLRFGGSGGGGAYVKAGWMTGKAEGSSVDLSGFDVSGGVRLAF